MATIGINMFNCLHNLKEVQMLTRKRFMNKISRVADTKKKKIDVAITYRVVKLTLDALAKMPLKDVGKVLTTK